MLMLTIGWHLDRWLRLNLASECWIAFEDPIANIHPFCSSLALMGLDMDLDILKGLFIL